MKLAALLLLGVLAIGCPQDYSRSSFKTCGRNSLECAPGVTCLSNTSTTCNTCNLVEACDASTALSASVLYPLYGPEICEICKENCGPETPAGNFCTFYFGGACRLLQTNYYECGGSCPIKGDASKCTWPANPPLFPADFRCGYQSSPRLCCTIYGSNPWWPRCPVGTP